MPPRVPFVPASPETPGNVGSRFVHLHNHTEFSPNDGIARHKEAVARAVAHGQQALAMTDHGTLRGAWKFAQACQKAGIKPILGVEAYLALPCETEGSVVAAFTPRRGDQEPYEKYQARLSAMSPEDFPVHPEAPVWSQAGQADPHTSPSDLPEQPVWNDPRLRFTRYTRHEYDPETNRRKDRHYLHLTLIAANETGWRNLCRIVNAAEASFYYQPRIDYALLHKYREGIVVLSGCVSGPVASVLPAGRIVENGVTTGYTPESLLAARESMARLKTCVEPGNLFVEVMEHNVGFEGHGHVTELFRIAHEFDLPVVATNDAHYVDCEDAHAHGAWLINLDEKIPSGQTPLTNPDRWQFTGHGYWIRSEDEMRSVWEQNEGFVAARDRALASSDPAAAAYFERFLARWNEAVDNTSLFLDNDFISPDTLPPAKLRLPSFPVPESYIGTPIDQKLRAEGYTASDSYLTYLVSQGSRRPERYGVGEPGAGGQCATITPEAQSRIREELGMIRSLGLSDYFLIVSDIINWARSDRGLPTTEFPEGKPGERKPMLVGPGRGSAAGSAVSYALDIVAVDPLRHDLLFERFLNPARLEMPDIDVDFEAARRNEVYDYTALRYGHEMVARIGAIQTSGSRASVKKAARLHGIGSLGEKIAAEIPMEGGSAVSFDTLFEQAIDKKTGEPKPYPAGRPFRDLYAGDPRVQQIVDLARSFESVATVDGIHAAGVLIGDAPLDSLIPMRKDRKRVEAVTKAMVAEINDSAIHAAEVKAMAEGGDIEAARKSVTKVTAERIDVPRLPGVSLWDGNDCSDFGLLKLDALSLSNLDIVSACLDAINNDPRRGPALAPMTVDDIPSPYDTSRPDVAAAFRLVAEGRTEGLFQLASSGMTELAEMVAPTEFDDLSALVALYRPGPMGANMHTQYADRKNGRAPVDYSIYSDNPAEQDAVRDVLDSTYGLIVYQEQSMALAGVLCGFTAKERDGLRKAIGKKLEDKIAEIKVLWNSQGRVEMLREDGSTKPAFSQQMLDNVWKTIEASAQYAFNKSHSVAYGWLSYQTAWLKANYPTEYAAALLTVVEKPDDRRAILKSLTEDGIDVLAPDVNLSGVGTRPDPSRERAVRLGLGRVAGVASNSSTIVAQRELGGEFTSMHDLVRRTAINSAVLTALIEAGACDSFGPRLGLSMIAKTAKSHDLAVPAMEWASLERCRRQRDRLGIIADEHPMVTYAEQVAAFDPNVVSFEQTTVVSRPVEPVAVGAGVSSGGSAPAWASSDDFGSASSSEGAQDADYWASMMMESLAASAPTQDYVVTERVSASAEAVTVDELADDAGGFTRIVGLLVDFKRKTTRRGDPMANFGVEGVHRQIEGVVFASFLSGLDRTGSAQAQVAGIDYSPGDNDPRNGQMVVVEGNVETRQIVMSEVDEDGRTVEKVRSVSQIKANNICILDLDDRPDSSGGVPLRSGSEQAVFEKAQLEAIEQGVDASVLKPMRFRDVLDSATLIADFAPRAPDDKWATKKKKTAQASVTKPIPEGAQPELATPAGSAPADAAAVPEAADSEPDPETDNRPQEEASPVPVLTGGVMAVVAMNGQRDLWLAEPAGGETLQSVVPAARSGHRPADWATALLAKELLAIKGLSISQDRPGSILLRHVKSLADSDETITEPGQAVVRLAVPCAHALEDAAAKAPVTGTIGLQSGDPDRCSSECERYIVLTPLDRRDRPAVRLEELVDLSWTPLQKAPVKESDQMSPSLPMRVQWAFVVQAGS